MSVKIRPYRGQEGIYEVDIIVRLPDGKEIRERKKSPVTGKEASKRWAADRERALFDLAIKGNLTKKEVPTMAEFWPRFLEGVMVAKRAAKGTLQVKDSHFRIWILPRFGGMKLDQIGPEEVARFTAALASKKSASAILLVLYQILRTAFEWGITSRMVQFHWPAKHEVKRNLFPPEKFEELVKQAEIEGPESMALVLLAGEAGLRTGEIQGLTWEQINWPRGQLTVDRAIYRGEKGTTKTGRSRTFKPTPRVLKVLQEIRHLRGPHVLAAEDGSPWSEGEVAKRVARLCKKVGVKKLGPHSLRHCAVQRMSLAGVPVDIIRQITGHKNLEILQTYLHDSVEATGLVAARLAALDLSPSGEILEKAPGAEVVSLARTRRKRSSGTV